VPVDQFVVFEWTAAPGTFILYDHFQGTTNPPAIPVKSGTATKDSTKFLSYNTKYYWYIAPRNSTGSATGCLIDSFTTAPAPANCIPLTTSNCRVNDTLKLVKLTGENGTSINNPSTCSPNGYADYTASSNLQMAQGKAYSGFLHASFVHDFFTIWIDYNDDGFFTNNERVLNNLRQDWSAKPTPFTINIASTASTGTHKMRVRNVYYAVNPAVGSVTTDPCNNYQYSETEDYTVTIIPASTASNAIVSAGANNNCMQTGFATIDDPSNNNTDLVQLVDSTNAVVAAIDANGNDLGIVQVTVYKNAGTIRTLANGTKVLDRNITIKPQFQPASPVRVRLYLTHDEFMALQGSDPTITGVSTLSITKFDEDCSTTTSQATGVLVAQNSNGNIGTDHYVDVTVSSFSNFYIHGGLSAPLPVNIVSFTGQRKDTKIDLEWITATETNNKGFELQRSADGRNFGNIAFIATKALQGMGNTKLQYKYTDERPMNGTNYYRLKQVDKDGKSSYSAVVSVRSAASDVIFIDVFPNPVKDLLKIKLGSPTVNKIDVLITDLTGRIVKQQSAQLITGDNLVQIPVTSLQAGQYFVKLVCSNGCLGAITKIMKE